MPDRYIGWPGPGGFAEAPPAALQPPPEPGARAAASICWVDAPGSVPPEHPATTNVVIAEQARADLENHRSVAGTRDSKWDEVGERYENALRSALAPDGPGSCERMRRSKDVAILSRVAPGTSSSTGTSGPLERSKHRTGSQAVIKRPDSSQPPPMRVTARATDARIDGFSWATLYRAGLNRL
jgi:hypothetical protein